MSPFCPKVLLAVALIAANSCVAFATSCHGANAVPFYRYYNSGNGDHFYTTNFAELGVGKSGYAFEGLACLLPKEGTAFGLAKLYRYYNSQTGDHFYTTNYNELGGGKDGYVSEGIAGYVFAHERQGAVKLYRYYNGKDHFYTTDYSELGAGSQGYKLEGIAGYVFKADAS